MESRPEGDNDTRGTEEPLCKVHSLAQPSNRGRTIARFASLAERLDALAAERARPWWRRLAG
jgi:hypothetical protein